MSDSTERFVGIDVSKGVLDVFADPAASPLPAQCSYDDASLRTLCDSLQALAPTLVVMEASGGLEQRLAVELAARGVSLAVVNPAKCATTPVPPASWPRPTRSMRESCAASPRPSSLIWTA